MNPLPDDTDTICAVATPAGAAGIAVVRVSGREALAVAARVVPALSRATPAEPRRLRLCRIVSPRTGERLDQGLVVVMPGPRSYTAEDVVELQLHGGVAVVRATLTALREAGARLAEPGEFTLRAFLHGRIDLSEAEAVAALVEARTDAARRVALRQLDGGLRRAVEPLYDDVVARLAEIEAHLDFTEHDLEAVDRAELDAGLRRLEDEIERLLDDAPRGRRIRQGARVVLMGRPNVGKSSLLNALVGRERAIVDEAPGTTRDWLEDDLVLGGFAVTVVDTAGLRDTATGAEQVGVRRGRDQAALADLVIYVINLAEGVTDEDRAQLERLDDSSCAVVLNQRDRVDTDTVARALSELSDVLDGTADILAVTVAPSGQGIEELRRALLERLGLSDQGAALPLLTEQRHEETLAEAQEGILAAQRLFAQGEPEEVVALELRRAAQAIGGLLGKGVQQAVLQHIFSRFCVGK